MPIVHISTDVNVWCSCGEGICHLCTGGDGVMTTEPCTVCIEAARLEGYEEGHTVGHDEGYEEGLEEGRKDPV